MSLLLAALLERTILSEPCIHLNQLTGFYIALLAHVLFVSSPTHFLDHLASGRIYDGGGGVMLPIPHLSSFVIGEKDSVKL